MPAFLFSFYNILFVSKIRLILSNISNTVLNWRLNEIKTRSVF